MNEHDTAQASHDADHERDAEYPQGLKLFSIVVAIMLSMFLIALDQGIVATAVPKITDRFHSVDDVGWYGSAYLLMTCLQLFYGKLYTVFPLKAVFLASIILFEAGSLICGLAPSSIVLIVGRVIAGIGGSGVYSGGFILLAQTVPLSKRPLYAALDSATFGLGSVSGPLLGGVFTDKLSWRWCFYINLPFGVLTAVTVFLLFKSSKTSDQDNKDLKAVLAGLDSLGIALLMASLLCLLLALHWGGLQFSWGNSRMIVVYIFSAVLFAAFLSVQHWVPAVQSSLPSEIVRQRSIAAGCVYYMGWGGSFMPLVYFLPIWFQAIQGVSAFSSGIRTIPMILAYVVASIGGGVVVTKVGYYKPLLVASSLLMAVGAGLISTFTKDSGPAQWIGFQVVYGVGLGLGADLPLVAAQTVLSRRQIPRATALLVLFQTLSATVFISVCESIFVNRLGIHLQHLLPDFDLQTLTGVGAVDLISKYDTKGDADLLSAYNSALAETFVVSVVLASITIIGSLAIENGNVKAGDES
ncbi:major facilitator superfamily domain-containing protein [Lophiotrema nucula]|uniref:Major facilitator superfamily domain-containing protein n=1 Tax=Lophiotrema nucula TaxID=690887 RepID=A0A6A5Z1F4_9PLEO|nr:major facilitator superfamily domain-containing protein [Lophiotrema nucula]